MKQKCLMLGCGRTASFRRLKAFSSAEEEDTQWVRLDHDPDSNPDWLFNLNHLEVGGDLPEGDFDEIHAYDVLEHFGQQGDFKGYYNTFNALWRALKPGGLLFGYVPRDHRWSWGDPGHCRVITQQTLNYLTKAHLSLPTTTNYLACIKGHFWKVLRTEEEGLHMLFCLQKDSDDSTV